MKFKLGDIIIIGKSKYIIEIGEISGNEFYVLKCHASGKYAFFGIDFIETFGKKVNTNNNH